MGADKWTKSTVDKFVKILEDWVKYRLAIQEDSGRVIEELRQKMEQTKKRVARAELRYKSHMESLPKPKPLRPVKNFLSSKKVTVIFGKESNTRKKKMRVSDAYHEYGRGFRQVRAEAYGWLCDSSPVEVTAECDGEKTWQISLADGLYEVKATFQTGTGCKVQGEALGPEATVYVGALYIGTGRLVISGCRDIREVVINPSRYSKIRHWMNGVSSDCEQLGECTLVSHLSGCTKRCSNNEKCTLINYCRKRATDEGQCNGGGGNKCCLKQCKTTDVKFTTKNKGWSIFAKRIYPELIECGACKQLRCGPKFKGCQCPKSNPYCNEATGWCGASDAHKYAQISTDFDYFMSCDAVREKCCSYNQKYGKKPGGGWGTTPAKKKEWYNANQCDSKMGGPNMLQCPFSCRGGCDLVREKCCKLNTLYNMVPFVTWGTTPETERKWAELNNCHDKMGGNYLNKCPYSCDGTRASRRKRRSLGLSRLVARLRRRQEPSLENDMEDEAAMKQLSGMMETLQSASF